MIPPLLFKVLIAVVKADSLSEVIVVIVESAKDSRFLHGTSSNVIRRTNN